MTHHPPVSLFLLALLLPGCFEGRDVLDPVAQARADAVAVEALPAVQAAVGMVAVGGELCGYTLEQWQDMGTGAPELPADLAAWFGIEEPGVLRAYPARGQYDVTWGGAVFFGQDVALKVTVATPMTALTVLIDEPGTADDTGLEDTGATQDVAESLASAVLATSGCGGGDHLVTGTLSYPISGDYDWAVTVAGAEGEGEDEDEDGMAVPDGALLPARGTLSWSGTTAYGRASMQTEDASTIADDAWPATVSGRDWEAGVSLPLE
jgi:hypothetical protein